VGTSVNLKRRINIILRELFEYYRGKVAR
jgi:hypothetical protein